jgi:hypothetical protein
VVRMSVKNAMKTHVSANSCEVNRDV